MTESLNENEAAVGRSDSNAGLGFPPCQGKLCGATDGISHSPECFAEHEVTISKGELDTPGNRNPECRYRGYKNEPLLPGATKDQQAAWDEGNKARAYSWAVGYITANGDIWAEG